MILLGYEWYQFTDFIISKSDHQPIIEGAFQYNHDFYHIKSTFNYNLAKRSNDPFVSSAAAKMIIYRDSDTSVTKRDADSGHQCGFDKLLHQSTQQRDNDFADVILGRGGLLKKRFDQGCPTTKKSKIWLNEKISPFFFETLGILTVFFPFFFVY